MQKLLNQTLIGLLIMALLLPVGAAYAQGGQSPAMAAAPVTVWPTGETADQTIQFVWQVSPGATQYKYQLYKGTTLKFTKTVNAVDICPAAECTTLPTGTLPTGTYKWRVKAYDGVGGWGAWSAYAKFKITFVPTPKTPSGQIEDRSPDFVWSAVGGVDQYHYQLWKGTNLVFEYDVPSAGCTAFTCTAPFPGADLSLGSYKWRVQAQVGGIWKSYSAFKSFAEVIWPNPGVYTNLANDWFVFQVSADRHYVKRFQIGISVTGCGNYIITRSSAKISNSKFSWGGTYFGNGTFTSTITAAGKAGLNDYFISGCGYISGGPWSWAAQWVAPLPVIADAAMGGLQIQSLQGSDGSIQFLPAHLESTGP